MSIVALVVTILTLPQPMAELVDPQSYAIKRFQEVVSSSVGNEPKTIQERLISDRAHLVIVERELEAAISNQNDPNSVPSEKSEAAVKPQMAKALKARVDYYRKRIAALEERLLHDKKKGVASGQSRE